MRKMVEGKHLNTLAYLPYFYLRLWLQAKVLKANKYLVFNSIVVIISCVNG